MKGILGTKVGMTQIWQGERLIPVTVVLAGPCPVVQRFTPASDGYSAVQLGWVEKPARNANKPDTGHFKANGTIPQRHLVEFRDYSPEGNEVTVAIFEPGQVVDVTGTSKGRGTSGVMRRWNFSGMGRSHGVKKKHRHGGSIGQRKNASRVWKGKKMAGQYGNERVTSQGLELIDVRGEENLLLIKGNVPGPKGGLVIVRQNRKDS